MNRSGFTVEVMFLRRVCPQGARSQAGAVAPSARISTSTPLKAAVPEGTSIPPGPVMAFRFAPGCFEATRSCSPGPSWPHPCGRLTTPRSTESLTSTVASLLPATDDHHFGVIVESVVHPGQVGDERLRCEFDAAGWCPEDLGKSRLQRTEVDAVRMTFEFRKCQAAGTNAEVVAVRTRA